MPTPPPEFSLEEWMAGIARMREARFRQLYLTHFGTVDDVEEHWTEVEELLRVGTERIGRAIAGGEGREEILSNYTQHEDERLLADDVDEEGRKLYASVGPPGMSVDGIMRYWRKKPGAPQPSA
jgi:hypothetical protein